MLPIFLILTFGVLHGANDITLISSFSVQKSSTKHLFLAYIGAVAMVSFLFLISKGAAFIIFYTHQWLPFWRTASGKASWGQKLFG